MKTPAQWLVLPLVLALSACGKTAPPPPASAAPAAKGATVSVTGRARTVQGVPIVVRVDGGRLRVSLPKGWPPAYEGRLVIIQGELQPNLSRPGAEPIEGVDDDKILVYPQIRLLE